MISEDEEIISLAAAVQVPAVYICRKSWDSWPAEEGASVISIYPKKPEDVLEAIERLCPAFCVQNKIFKSDGNETEYSELFPSLSSLFYRLF